MIGSQFGGSTGSRIAAGVAGAAIGGLVGNRIGAAMDDEDKRRAYEAQGAKIKAFYLLLGRHDAVVISEAPDDELIHDVMTIVADAGGIEYARRRGEQFAQEAEDALASVPPTPARAALQPSGSEPRCTESSRASFAWA